MSVDESLAGSTGTSVQAEETVVAGLSRLYEAYQKASIYAPRHPTVVHSILDCAEALNAAVCAGESLSLRVERDRIRRDETVLPDESGALASLAGLLRDLGIRGLRVEPAVEADEIDTLIHALGRARREGLRGAPIAEMLEGGNVRRLGVAVGDAVENTMPAAPLPEEDVWESLETLLREEPSREDDLEPERIAEAVHRQLAEHEDTGVGRLRARMQDVARELASSHSPRAEIARKRLSRFVAALNPKLRQDLLRFDPRLAEESLDLMGQLGDVLPEPDLLEALQNLDREGARVPEQLLTLMGKLVRIARSRPTLASGLRDTMTKWGVASSAMGDENELREALEEVFRRRQRIECNPIPHQELLDTLANYEFEAPSTLSLSRYEDPADPLRVRQRTTEIAVRLAALPGGDEHRPGLFLRLTADVERLLSEDRFDTLCEAADAARAYTLLERLDVETYRAAAALLDELRRTDRAETLVERLSAQDPMPASGERLLEFCGDAALGPAADSLLHTSSASVAAGMQHFLGQAGAEALRPVFRDRIGRGWSSWQRWFGVLRRMRRDSALEIVPLLLDHDEFEVRREALVLMHDLGGDRERRLVELRRALISESPRFARVAVRCLAEMDGEEPRALLGDYLDGSLGVEPVFDAGMRAAQSLLRMKQPGTERLCLAISRMQRHWHPRRIALTRRVVELLASHRDPAARECVRGWRRSPARLVSIFVPRTAELGNGGRS